MPDPTRKIRGLLYTLADLERAFRLDGRLGSALEIGAVARRWADLPAEAFLDAARSTLEAALLGERNLSAQLVSDLLDAMSAIDALFAEISR